jgi:hypothetical protein
MASIIRKDSGLSFAFGVDDGEQVDALVLEELGAEFIFDEAVYEKAREMFMDDARLAGATLVQLSRWFGIPLSTLGRRYAEASPPPVPQEMNRYIRRLGECVKADPDSFADLVEALQRKAGTSDQAKALLYMLGSRRQSAETCLGEARKSRRKRA